MKKYLLLLTVLLSLAGCSERDLYEPAPAEERKDFSLFDKINVDIQLPENTRCLLFTSYPYTDGDMTGEAILETYAPFNGEIRVPKAVDKLYMYANGEILVLPRKDIKVSSLSTRSGGEFTRAGGDDEPPGNVTQVNLSDAFVTAIYNYYPEKHPNVVGEDLKVSTDLIAPEGKKSEQVINGVTVIEEWGNTKVWITYVGDGGCNFAGTLWYYTYKVNDNKEPITSLSDIEKNKVLIFENATPANSKGKRVYLGEFEPGTRIGFKYLGNATINSKPYPKYSTPHYNFAAYGPNEANYATCGVIRSWEYNKVEYATLGMENRLPSESAWDDDFNDMICLLEADPLFVENRIDPPKPDPTTIRWKGYWLFEDNYPYEGDYDFNDLVVKYAVTETKGKPTIIDMQFLAKGAYYDNSFGVNGTINFEHLGGYENVYPEADAVEPVSRQITLPAAETYIPLLNNGKVSFTLNSYYDNEEDFPCVLEIPIIDDSKFQWCLENVRIDAAYPRYKDWVNSNCTKNTDWYLDTPVTGTVWNK